ncbi:MAG TPA: phosphatase PAP2 family protein [Solirubrobacteraceae bacterium]|nr:phosphatase PAP2 family protein [Solirubrobacteraceae bacterium]
MSHRSELIRLTLGFILLLLIGWGLGELAVSVTQASDLDAVRDVAAERTAALTVIAWILTTIGSGYVMFPLTIVVAVVLYATRRPAAAAVVVLSMAGAVVIANVDKRLVGRSRPPVHHLEAVSSASFPSGHTSQATAFFVSLLVVFLVARRGQRGPAAAAAVAAGLLIVGVAWSRVYLAVHYPSDVAGGFLLAGAWSLILVTLLLRGRRRAGSRTEVDP